MRRYLIRIVLILLPVLPENSVLAQGKYSEDKAAILGIIDKYSRSVISRDSLSFYALFNQGKVTWAAALTERSHAKELGSGKATAASGYFEGSYQQFMRGLSRYEATEDKFDKIVVTTDGTVAAVTMDYSFWANGSMTNWGCKYLGLIKRDGE